MDFTNAVMEILQMATAVTQPVRLKEAGLVLLVRTSLLIYEGNSEEMELTMALMNETTEIKLMEMAEVKTVQSNYQGLQCGSAQVEMIWPLTFVMNGEVMASDMKIHGNINQEETSLDFKKLLEMMAILEVEKDEMVSVGSKKALSEEEVMIHIRTFEGKNEETGGISTMINVMMEI